jgi:hypothetical protein
MQIEYTRHAREKFMVLERHGCPVTTDQVEATVRVPDSIEADPPGRAIAQRGLDEQRVLRVVYRQDGERRVIITFYPGRRERYAPQL